MRRRINELVQLHFVMVNEKVPSSLDYNRFKVLVGCFCWFSLGDYMNLVRRFFRC
jgi:hypothetical protein